jgi:hypothetical protein
VSRTFQTQDPIFEFGFAWLAEALSCCPALPPAGPSTSLSVALYGAGDGAIALERAAAVGKALRDVGALGGGGGAAMLHVTLVDDPAAADFAALAAAAAAAADGGGVLASSGHAAVTALVPRALHGGAAAPPASVHVGVAVGALARLSSPPCCPGRAFFAGDDDADDASRDAFRARAVGDAASFLRERAREAVPGGLLLIVVPGALGPASAAAASLTAVRDAAAAAVDDGVVDGCLLASFAAPLYCWSARELEAAAAASGEWAVLQRGCAALPSAYDAHRAGAIDAAAYGRALAEEGAALLGSSLRDGLGLSPAAEAGLWARAAALAAADPARYAQRSVAAAVLLQRRGSGAAPRPRTAGRQREWFESRRRSTDV